MAEFFAGLATGAAVMTIFFAIVEVRRDVDADPTPHNNL